MAIRAALAKILGFVSYTLKQQLAKLVFLIIRLRFAVISLARFVPLACARRRRFSERLARQFDLEVVERSSTPAFRMTERVACFRIHSEGVMPPVVDRAWTPQLLPDLPQLRGTDFVEPRNLGPRERVSAFVELGRRRSSAHLSAGWRKTRRRRKLIAERDRQGSV